MSSDNLRADTSHDITLIDDDYADLLRFRDALRRFLRWSERQARAAGLTPGHHQLLLAVRGHPGDPTVGDVADHLLLRHHSAVELVDRAVQAGLVERRTDDDDRRVVRVSLTDAGSRRLDGLAAIHLEELGRLHSSLRLRALETDRIA
jgi:DNA-binding MarR family transcriptional regulator